MLPADDLPLSLPGDERSSGVTGGGDLKEPEPREPEPSEPELREFGDKPQWSGLAQWG